MDLINGTTVRLPVVITLGYVAFPTQQTTLNVQREFSLNAINDSKDSFESYCVVVSQKNFDIGEVTSYDEIYNFGSVCKILETVNSNSVIRTRILGFKRAKLLNLEFDNDKRVFFADVQILETVYGEQAEEAALVKQIVEKIDKNASSSLFNGPFSQELKYDLRNGVAADELCYSLASKLNCSTDKKVSILSENDLNKRLLNLLLVIQEIINSNKIDREIMKAVQENSEKQQKDYYLREKMRAIKKELGEDGSSDELTINDKLENNPYPNEVKAKIKDELKRKELMPQGSLENSLIQDYIDIVLSVPWFESTKDNNDIGHAKSVLDEDHYGLKNVKERIIEYLAVKKVKDNLKAPILCFYGPPGCGKTSLSKSIAKALDRKFIKCSLGGVSDEAEIRGHRRTYVGSRPGRIINSLRKIHVNNPVFLLDEIDKLSHDSFKGDPASALLEVLDPEQNKNFTDNYLELDYDLSNVLFVCTANNIENIPGPLLDRLELIQVPSYTSIDKLHIAKDFLIKKELLNNGLTENDVKFTDEGIFYIIDRYTRESGVRSLERNIASVLRKIVVEKLENNDLKEVIVGPKEVAKYLGVEIYDSLEKEKDSQIGVVTGLAYTEYGGEILPIEVNYFPGKGRLSLTGKLGDVMKESCEIALDYVKANAQKYGIDSKLFEENDIHVHVPEGAVPKDGPSAGVTITIAFISALSKKPVSGNIAMTGEVTLRGNALPIGGLREKSLAAMRSGIKKIIIPDGNRRNVTELPKEVTENLEIVYMKNVDDAYKVIFE